MAFALFVTPKFLKLKKKATKALQKELDENIGVLLESPNLGELKKGDLAGVRVYKFKHADNQILIAYRVDIKDSKIILYAFGTHENFYRELKKYMKEIK